MLLALFEAVPEVVAEEQTVPIARFCPRCGAPYRGADLHFGHTCAPLRLAGHAEVERLRGPLRECRCPATDIGPCAAILPAGYVCRFRS